MTLMPYRRRCSIAQSIASITLLATPEPSSPSTRRLTIRAPLRDAAELRVSTVRPGLPGDDRRHVRAVAVPIHAVAAREVHVATTRRRSAACRFDARVDHRHGDASPVSGGTRSLPAHTWSAPMVSRRHVRDRPHRDVRRQMILLPSSCSASS